jgi:urease gamma subunit
VSQHALEGGKVESRFADGTRLVRFRNGTEREVSAEGVATTRFANGDVRKSLPSGEEVYYYEAAGTLQHTREGYDVFEFLATGQVELHWGPAHANRGVEVLFPDGSVRLTRPQQGAAASGGR